MSGGGEQFEQQPGRHIRPYPWVVDAVLAQLGGDAFELGAIRGEVAGGERPPRRWTEFSDLDAGLAGAGRIAEVEQPSVRACHHAAQAGSLLAAFGEAGVDVLELATDDDLVDTILRFADLRKRVSQLSGGGMPRHLTGLA